MTVQESETISKGDSVSMSITEPRRSGCDPPAARIPWLAILTSSRNKNHAEHDQGKAGIIDGEGVERIKSENEGDHPDDPGRMAPGLYSSNKSPYNPRRKKIYATFGSLRMSSKRYFHPISNC